MSVDYVLLYLYITKRTAYPYVSQLQSCISMQHYTCHQELLDSSSLQIPAINDSLCSAQFCDRAFKNIY